MGRRDFTPLFGPSFVVMAAFLVLPVVRTVEWSFEKVQYGAPGEFVGFANYTAALTDPRFGRAVFFTVLLTLVATAILLVFGYLVAIGVDRLRRLRPVLLGVMLVSYVLPHVVGATSFSWLFDQNFGGVIDYAISSVTGAEFLWFTETWPNRAVLIADTVWHLLPFSMLIILAGLQGVPAEIREAAQIDGASPLMTHLFVIVPTIRGVLGFVCLISIMDVLRTFDPLIPLSPQADAIGNETIMLYIYDVAFRDGSQALGLGSAINVLTIILILIMLYPFVRSLWAEGRAAT